MNGDWLEFNAVLEDVCFGDSGAKLAIGVIRFASSSKRHIPAWDSLIAALVAKATSEGLDVAHVLRGLI